MDYWDTGRLRYMWSVVYSCGKWWMCVVKVYELWTCTYVRVSHLIRHFLYQFLFLYLDSVISSDSGLSNSPECYHKSMWSNSMLQVPAVRLVFIIKYLLMVWWSVNICFVLMNMNKSIKLMLTLGTYLHKIKYWTCSTPFKLNVIQISTCTQIGDCILENLWSRGMMKF